MSTHSITAKQVSHSVEGKKARKKDRGCKWSGTDGVGGGAQTHLGNPSEVDLEGQENVEWIGKVWAFQKGPHQEQGP